jgi:hypothetical protein
MICGFKVVLVSDDHSSFSKDAAQLIEKWNQAFQEKGANVVEAREVNLTHHAPVRKVSKDLQVDCLVENR